MNGLHNLCNIIADTDSAQDRHCYSMTGIVTLCTRPPVIAGCQQKPMLEVYRHLAKSANTKVVLLSQKIEHNRIDCLNDSLNIIN